MQVTKRDGRVMEFCSGRIVDAVVKAMNQTPDGADLDLANKIALSVEKQLETRDEVTVYEIQDLVEKKLMASSRKEVATAYITYRYIRDIARKSKTKEVFLDIITSKSNYFRNKEKENFLDTPKDMMRQFAAETIKPYVDTFLLSKETKEAEKFGYLNILSKGYYPTKSINSVQLPFYGGAEELKDIENIEGAIEYIFLLVNRLREEVDGSLSMPAIDYFLAPFVRKTFEEELNKYKEGFEIEFEESIFIEDYIYLDVKNLKGNDKFIQLAINRTLERVRNALKIFMISFSSKKKDIFYNSINYGTDTSAEGRCIIRELLNLNIQGFEKYNVLNQIWKKKKGINHLPEDKNYDLYECFIGSALKKSFFTILNLDATFNINNKWKEGDKRRSLYECSNISDFRINDSNIRGVISSVSINLPKVALESVANLTGKSRFDYEFDVDFNRESVKNIFFDKLKINIEIAISTLLERFKFQTSAIKNQFPMLMSGLWYESDRLSDEDTVEEVLKNGVLGIGITGLSECLITLIKKHHGESSEAQDLGIEIITKIRNWIEEYSEKYNLKFALIQMEDFIGRFADRDKVIYGFIMDITEKHEYTYGTSIPVEFKCTIEDRIKIEAPYQSLCIGGGAFIFNKTENIVYDDIKNAIDLMDDYNLGLMSFR